MTGPYGLRGLRGYSGNDMLPAKGTEAFNGLCFN